VLTDIARKIINERSDMYQRINIALPETTVLLIDRLTNKRNRGRFIDAAVKYYTEEIGKADLREQLRQGAIRRAERDLNLSREWNSLEEEAWEKR
jgi:CopG family transcriptional regulator/antitoxin EndoAI